ncbi:MAG: tRNA (cytidine(34)-2'-O)-methyltransferase [Coprobacillus sp.]|nr:tRNA (cytidine(34)-2'-O)-methyltransferase [Coprobacillus sp.]
MNHIILYQPEKPQNTGNIMRTCTVTGAVLHIIGPLTFSLDDKSLKRAGLDYIEDLKWHYYESYEDFLEKFGKDKDIYYVTRYSNKVYTSFDYSDTTKDYYFMFGKESTGIPHDILRAHEDRIIRIPMKMNSRSLNLSNCVAIILYEALRQQSFNDLATHETIKGENFLDEEIKK